MIESLPFYISVFFALTTIATLWLFTSVLRGSDLLEIRKNTSKIVFGLLVWLSIQAMLALNNVFNMDTNSIPPKIAIVGILPPPINNSATICHKKREEIYR